MPEPTTQVCAKHIRRPASHSCGVCGKALCLECVAKVGGLDFCSPDCARKSTQAMQNLAQDEKRHRQQWRRAAMVNGLRVLVLLAMLAIVAVWYYSLHPEPIDRWFTSFWKDCRSLFGK